MVELMRSKIIKIVRIVRIVTLESLYKRVFGHSTA